MRFVHIADMHFDMQFKMLSDKIGIGEQRRYDQRVILRKIINYICARAPHRCSSGR